MSPSSISRCSPRPAAQQRREREHDAEARWQAGDDDMQRQARLVPVRHERGGELQRHHGLRGQQQRKQQRRHQPVGQLVPCPMHHRTAPAERAKPVEQRQHVPPARRRAFAHGRKVRDQADVPEQPGHQHMRGDAPEIPDQRRAELRPDLVGRGIGEHPME
jgi:hypothetical protein